MLEGVARPELIAGKPSPDQLEVVQQNLQATLFPLSDEIVVNKHGGTEEYLDVLPVHEPVQLALRQVAGSDIAGEPGIPFQVVQIFHQARLEQFRANAGSGVGGDALHVGKVYLKPSCGAKYLPDLVAAVVGVADDEPAHDGNLMLAQKSHRLLRLLPDIPFLKELEGFHLHRFYAEEHQPEVGPCQQRNQFRI